MKAPSARILAAALALAVATQACGTAPASRDVPPPAPPARVDTSPPAPPRRPAYTPADARFMAGMIVHHAQAVLMAGWAAQETRGASVAVRVLSERITVAQRDEIAFLERWLREHGEAVPDTAHSGTLPGMKHSPLMPGMLTPEQAAQLEGARGPEFDRAFLTFMIQHHRGAIVMVEQLLGTPGAAQDGIVFRFAADVHADQSAEIERMTRMLAASPPAAQRP